MSHNLVCYCIMHAYCGSTGILRALHAQRGSSDPRLERQFCHIVPVLPALSEAEGSSPKGQDLTIPRER